MTTRDEFVEKAKKQLDHMNAEMDKLQAKMKDAETGAKAEYEKHLVEMRKNRDEAQEQLNNLQRSGDAAWDDMRSGFEKSWEAMQAAFQNAMSRFK